MVVEVVVELPPILFFELDMAVKLHMALLVEVVEVVVVAAVGAAPKRLLSVTTLLEVDFSAVLSELL